MAMAVPGLIPFQIVIPATIGIGLAASSAAVINHILDRHIDFKMGRTEKRPLPTGIITPKQAIIFSVVLAVISMSILLYFVNILTALLTFLTLLGYAFFYTLFLKHATPQNIVIGGITGAAPPLLGWAAMTGSIDPNSLLLVLIIFVWTPPHFWALAIYRYNDYAKANVPMLPVTHGIKFTKISIVLYTVLLLAVSVLPFVMGLSGLIYFISAIILGLVFLYWTIKLYLTTEPIIAMQTFRYSITYLMVLFTTMLIDHYYLF